ncbi:hypothetical protein DKP78_25185, partial [Enterococcus faecium]
HVVVGNIGSQERALFIEQLDASALLAKPKRIRCHVQAVHRKVVALLRCIGEAAKAIACTDQLIQALKDEITARRKAGAI